MKPTVIIVHAFYTDDLNWQKSSLGPGRAMSISAFANQKTSANTNTIIELSVAYINSCQSLNPFMAFIPLREEALQQK
jgi:hypothetical protein